jgi:hypothetical protein
LSTHLSSKSPSLQRVRALKREREKKVLKKEKGKKKTPRVSANKKGKSVF